MRPILTVSTLLIALYAPVSTVSAKQPEEEASVLLYVNLWKKRLYLQTSTGEVLASFPIAPGAVDTPSPIGVYSVIQKAKNWAEDSGPGGWASMWSGERTVFTAPTDRSKLGVMSAMAAFGCETKTSKRSIRMSASEHRSSSMDRSWGMSG